MLISIVLFLFLTCMFPQTHLSCSRVSVYESTSPRGFSHDAWRLLTPELLRVMVLNAMGTATHRHTLSDHFMTQ